MRKAVETGWNSGHDKRSGNDDKAAKPKGFSPVSCPPEANSQSRDGINTRQARSSLWAGGMYLPGHQERRTMIRVSALALAIAVAAAGTVSPASAQTSTASPSVASHKTKASGQSARPLYNMAPGNGPVLGRDSPAGTGGGSIGYNQMLYNW
jgi:hypothetical protein